jgi:hypothetical protein
MPLPVMRKLLHTSLAGLCLQYMVAQDVLDDLLLAA